MPRKPDPFPTQSVHAALNSAVRAAGHLADDQRPVVALARVLAKRVDKLDKAGFVIDGRFDNVSAGMLLKTFDALGLTVKESRGARRSVPREESLVPPSADPEETTPPVTDMERFRQRRAE
jgi:hypothetical protein